MTDAVIVSTARTPLCKSWRGALNMTHGATMGGHVVKHAIERAGIDPAEVEDVLMGCATPEGRNRRQHRAPDRAARRAAGHHVGRDREPLLLLGPADHRDGLAARDRRRRPTSSSPAAWSRSPACRTRCQQAHGDTRPGSSSTSPRSTGTCCRRPRPSRSATPSAAKPRTATACRASTARRPRRLPGKTKDEIVPITTMMKVVDKATNVEESTKVTASDATRASAPTPPTKACPQIKPVFEGGVIAAGNASQFSDGASAAVVMNDKLAAAPRPEAHRHLPRLRGRRLRAGRDGHRPGLRDPEAARARLPAGHAGRLHGAAGRALDRAAGEAAGLAPRPWGGAETPRPPGVAPGPKPVPERRTPAGPAVLGLPAPLDPSRRSGVRAGPVGDMKVAGAANSGTAAEPWAAPRAG